MSISNISIGIGVQLISGEANVELAMLGDPKKSNTENVSIVFKDCLPPSVRFKEKPFVYCALAGITFNATQLPGGDLIQLAQTTIKSTDLDGFTVTVSHMLRAPCQIKVRWFAIGSV